VDSIRYLSLEGLRRAVAGDVMTDRDVGERFCSACFTGDYPTPIYEQYAKDMMVPRLFGDKLF
jgi:glutamine phosphoribosylpyrophosphate amidotransferase